MHDEAPAEPLKVPAVQLVHAELPAAAYDPGEHALVQADVGRPTLAP